jgi:Protein of unknown function (DUF3499)
MRQSYGDVSSEAGREADRSRRGIRSLSVAVDSVGAMQDRLCSKVACAREAVSTLTYDYGDQMAAVGPLGAVGDPHAHDLCAIHTDRMSVPRGWVVVRHETLSSR